MSPIERIMRTAPVIPVLVIDYASQARPIAEALVAGGLKVLEVTLRTPAALDAIRENKHVPAANLGAGSDQQDLRLAARRIGENVGAALNTLLCPLGGLRQDGQLLSRQDQSDRTCRPRHDHTPRRRSFVRICRSDDRHVGHSPK